MADQPEDCVTHVSKRSSSRADCVIGSVVVAVIARRVASSRDPIPLPEVCDLDMAAAIENCFSCCNIKLKVTNMQSVKKQFSLYSVYFHIPGYDMIQLHPGANDLRC